MLSKDEISYLENIIQGNAIEEQENIAASTRNYLCRSFKASNVAERKFEYFQRIKKEQEEIICKLSNEKNWWITNLGNYHYLTEGGESKIYFENNNKFVIKLNDAIYYNTWLDFLNSILLHNFFFPTTHYSFVGFHKDENTLYAVLKQVYISTNQPTNLDAIKDFLGINGFQNLKRFDYYHPEYKITIEDLHDENVLTVDDNLFFIDTIFLL